MTAAPAIDFTYRYPFASSVREFERGFGLRLATCSGDHSQPHFFEGRIRDPRAVGDMLLVLSDVVRTHFYLRAPPILDPVVTSNGDMLRFEGFSGCCGVYARVDLPAEAFETEYAGRGTTNVDFNNPMRAALVRLRGRDDARLAVGADEVALSRGDERVVEKKVKLPARWIKGFSEVQAYQPRLELRLEVSGAEARRFIRGLPRGGAPKRPLHVTLAGRTLRLSGRTGPGSIRLTGTDRVRVLEPLMGAARSLRIWADDEAGTSGWEVVFDVGRFFLLVSPELYRGFSGEGQMLEKLATGDWKGALSHVRAQLFWQSQIDTGDLAERTGLEAPVVESALAVLGSRGLAGYDVTTGRYFHRELPFDLEQVEKLQPRLKGARKLLEDGKVRLVERTGEESVDLEVDGTDVTHLVRLRPDGDRCTCPWFSRHRGERGPCKHILASRIYLSDEVDETSEVAEETAS